MKRGDTETEDAKPRVLEYCVPEPDSFNILQRSRDLKEKISEHPTGHSTEIESEGIRGVVHVEEQQDDTDVATANAETKLKPKESQDE